MIWLTCRTNGVSPCSRYAVKTPRRVRHQLQVDECGLDQRVPKLAAQVVDLDAVHQRVAGVAVTQGVRANLAPGHDSSNTAPNAVASRSSSHQRETWYAPIPYRLDELDDWEKIVDLPRGTAHPVQSPELFPMPHAVRMYSNGDLLITFTYRNGVPGRGGIARIDRDGRPVWVRSDYSHHWPTIFKTSDGHESALVPGATIEDVPVVDRLGRKAPSFDTDCDDLNIVDHVLLMNGAGEVQQDIRLVDGILESPFAAMLYHSTYPCDLLHLNYIDRIREDVRGIPGVVPGDYVVSLRHISAFGIVDSQTGDVKRLVRGTFIYQHSVQHLSGSEFLLFDNDGADVEAGPSRVLLVDLADGAVRERTVYPTAGTPEDLTIYSSNRSNVSISRDRRRVLVASANQGIALELQIEDGMILNVFRNIHDMSGLSLNLEEAGDKAIYFVFKDLQYME